MFPGLDLYHADPAQPLTTASEELDDLQIMICARCWNPHNLVIRLRVFNVDGAKKRKGIPFEFPEASAVRRNAPKGYTFFWLSAFFSFFFFLF